MDREFLFQDMKINLLLDGKNREEKAAVKNVWHKGVNVFFDLYLHDLDKPLIIDSLYIRGIYNLSEEREYASVKEFVDEFLDFKYDKKSGFKGSRDDENLKQLESIDDDLAILSFMAKYDNDLSNVKIKSIEEYITSVKPETKILSDNCLRNHIMDINASEEAFYKAMGNIKNKSPREATRIFTEAVKIAASDGFINYNERIYLAEIMQAMREAGMSVQDCVI